jgi:glucan phosphoethanolaminetransferase (alkaline phosphatase superfamily)
MDRKSSNLPVYSLALSVVPWIFAVFAEFLPQAIGTIMVPLAYLSCFASIILAVIAIRRKTEQNIRLAKIAVVLNILFLLAMIYLFIRWVCSPKIVPP